ncbi:Rid family hydrolase [Nonomuraea africana]|uniref:Rid family hydrolase n=1 Tax=Nonomuraea africana TaxID=46171 RepID=UPI00298ED949|nr:Rid family hydrolase [Nonomuraea africana]
MIAFLGQGRMGVPMARRLVEAGHEVKVWRRGLGPVSSAVEGADLVITMLRDGPAVEEVLRQALPGLRPGATVVEMSTIGPEAVLALRELLPSSVGLVDAPVLGSVGPAADGTLTVLAGGDLTACRSVLSVFGTVRELGALGAGAALKVAVMGALVPAQVLLAETFAYGEAHGVSRSALAEVLEGTPLGVLAARVAAPAEETRYALGLAAKDVRLGAWEGATMARAASARLESAEASGYGDHDVTSIATHIADSPTPASSSSGDTGTSGSPASGDSGSSEGSVSSGDVGASGGAVSSGGTEASGGAVSPRGSGSRAVRVNPGSVPATNGFYSHAVRVGDMLYVSGQAAFDERGAVVGEGDMTTQAEVVFQNIGKILADQGADFADIAFIRTYLTDLDLRMEYGAVRRKYLTGPPPASTTVEVSKLFMPGLLLEVDLIVALP